MHLFSPHMLALSAVLSSIPASSFALSSTTELQNNDYTTYKNTTWKHLLASSTSVPTASCTMCSSPTTTSSVRRHTVAVGAAGRLAFEPNEIDAGIGDVVEFNFLALNHTLTQSTLSNPCTNIGGFSTGFNQFNPRNVSGKYLVQYSVKTLDPQWFFCAQTHGTSHCHAGMIFTLNPAGALESFIENAALTSGPLPAPSSGTLKSITPDPGTSTSLPFLAQTVGASSLNVQQTPSLTATSLSRNWTSPTLRSPTSSVVSTASAARGTRIGVLSLLLILLSTFLY